ncbi:MAG: hypothetical protein MJK04_00550 [Psychrosphaera sp.]|nr:hypothetical protein [Psychrosphaera sp.]
MNILQKSVLSAALMMASSICHAGPFNHVDHNDLQKLFGANSIDTLDCGSFSLINCITPSSLAQISTQWCYDQVPDLGDGVMFSVTDSYYTFANSQNVYILSASDNGTNGNNYSVTLHYSCYGNQHQGKKDHSMEG